MLPGGNTTSIKTNQDTTQVPFPLFTQGIGPSRPLCDTSATGAQTGNTTHPKPVLPRRPIQLEGYRKICFEGIPGFPNPIPQDIRKRLPKFDGNNAISCEDHLRGFLDMMSDYEVEAQDVIMKLFVQSLTEDAREWFKRLPELSIVD